MRSPAGVARDDRRDAAEKILATEPFDDQASEPGTNTGRFTITRQGYTGTELQIPFSKLGTAGVNDYDRRSWSTWSQN
jgi:hypothetical protein